MSRVVRTTTHEVSFGRFPTTFRQRRLLPPGIVHQCRTPIRYYNKSLGRLQIWADTGLIPRSQHAIPMIPNDNLVIERHVPAVARVGVGGAVEIARSVVVQAFVAGRSSIAIVGTT